MSANEKALVEITTRHHQDAIWFDESGIHDPNGYVAMAHKDRGELLARLRMLRTGEAPAAADGEVIYGDGYVFVQSAAQQSAKNAALRFMLENLAAGHMCSPTPRPWWRRVLDKVAA